MGRNKCLILAVLIREQILYGYLKLFNLYIYPIFTFMKFGFVKVVLIFWSFSLVGSSCISTAPSKRSHFTASLYEGKEIVKADVAYKLKPFKINKNRTYYWFNNDSIYSSQGSYSYRVLDGKYERFYINGSLKEQGAFNKGIKSGSWKYWTKEGQLKYQENWRNGVLIIPKRKKTAKSAMSSKK